MITILGWLFLFFLAMALLRGLVQGAAIGLAQSRYREPAPPREPHVSRHGDALNQPVSPLTQAILDDRRKRP